MRHLSSTQKNPHPHFQVTQLHTQKLRKEIPKSHSSRKVALTKVRSKWQWPEILGESTSIVIIFQEGKKKVLNECLKNTKTNVKSMVRPYLIHIGFPLNFVENNIFCIILSWSLSFCQNFLQKQWWRRRITFYVRFWRGKDKKPRRK